MRFFPECPDIPSELIEARDAGEVIFFCGAGVSLARAGLPSFYRLTESVLTDLGAAKDSDAYRLFQHMLDVEASSGIGGLLSPDRVFGLLERDFSGDEINRSVSKLLSPAPDTDLSAHRAMLTLAHHPDHGVRLVTTNFDRLFDAALPGLVSRDSQSLAALSDAEEWGVIHLHGRVNEGASGRAPSSFVLSTGAFGDAYLANGWAREFVHRVMRDFVTVFVGYAADDPPIRYLLEGMKSGQGHRRRAYAFQSATDPAAIASWADKGVAPIVYESGHETLWRALDLWADQAKDPQAWASSVLTRAGAGPTALKPFERGQFAHVIGSRSGARLLAESKQPPPADWLCVMDPSLRFRTPDKQTDGPMQFDGPTVDPFELYKLDSDSTPDITNNGIIKEMKVPEEAWDGFRANHRDLEDMKRESVASLRGSASGSAPDLPPRLWHLSIWLSNVAHQPAAPWWASRQNGLHPQLQQSILLRLQSQKDDARLPAIRYAWQLIFEAWRERPNTWRDLYDLKGAVADAGWNDAALREYRRVTAAFLKVRSSYFGPLPPKVDQEVDVRHLVHTDVAYPEGYSDIPISEEALKQVIASFRVNLERAAELEVAQSYVDLCSIRPDEEKEGDSYKRHHDLSAYTLHYLQLFNRLRDADKSAAMAEVARWRSEDEVFTRLRIWAAGEADLTKPREAAAIIHGLPDDDFWDSRHQRDFLLSLQMRWNEFSPRDCSRIARRILRGRKRWENEEATDHRVRRAYAVVSRLYWLYQQGCGLPFDLEEVTAKYRAVIPDWSPDEASSTAEDMDGRMYSVVDDTDCSQLEGLKAPEVLSTAAKIMREHEQRHSHARPFTGLLRSDPQLAFDALTWSSTQGEHPQWAWEALLNLSDNDQPIDLAIEVITAALLDLPDTAIAEIVHTICRWLRVKSKTLAKAEPLFSQLWHRILDVMMGTPAAQRGAIVRGDQEPDWPMEAINSPTGNLNEALFGTDKTTDLEKCGGLPSWLTEKLDRLLALDGNPRRFALVLLAERLNWLFYIDPSWTERSLLSVMGAEARGTLDYDAAWAGFLRARHSPTVELFARIKDELLKLPAPAARHERHQYERLAAFLFGAWRPGPAEPPLITDTEMRRALLEGDEQFREQMIWILDRWAPDDLSDWIPLVKRLIGDVWPKQLRANSPNLSRRWLEFLFSNPEMFGEVSEALLPKLSPVRGSDIWLRGSHGFAEKVTEDRAEAVVNVLDLILDEDRSNWPYGTGDLIDVLEHFELGQDAQLKFQSLSRRRSR